MSSVSIDYAKLIKTHTLDLLQKIPLEHALRSVGNLPANEKKRLLISIQTIMRKFKDRDLRLRVLSKLFHPVTSTNDLTYAEALAFCRTAYLEGFAVDDDFIEWLEEYADQIISARKK